MTSLKVSGLVTAYDSPRLTARGMVAVSRAAFAGITASPVLAVLEGKVIGSTRAGTLVLRSTDRCLEYTLRLPDDPRGRQLARRLARVSVTHNAVAVRTARIGGHTRVDRYAGLTTIRFTEIKKPLSPTRPAALERIATGDNVYIGPTIRGATIRADRRR